MGRRKRRGGNKAPKRGNSDGRGSLADVAFGAQHNGPRPAAPESVETVLRVRGTAGAARGTYVGELRDGWAHGRGRLEHADGHVYDCQWDDGRMNGRGRVAWADGEVYEGELRDNDRHGRGTYTYKDGSVYDGEWAGGAKHGNGTFKWADGSVYEGGFKGDHQHGRGKKTHPNGTFYDGEWAESKRHGQGSAKFDSGNVYNGEWKGDYQHGQGTMTYASGGVYQGQWVDGNHHGRATVKYASGEVYVGQFANGARHGWGTQTWPSGRTYMGEWKSGMERGKGTMTYPTGDVYEGEFLDRKEHGKGNMHYSTGIIYEGEWAAGKRHGKGTVRRPSGQISDGIWMHGELAEWHTLKLPTINANDVTAAKADREPFKERKLRSQRSQQRRVQAVTKNCEHCGVGDGQYKLRVCSGCNLALYCSAACQKAARRSHQRICDIISVLPSRDADRLVLRYDKDQMVDLDAGLRYATKYMGELKHLQINLAERGTEDAVTLSAKHLSSLLRSKTESLESVFWLCNYHWIPDLGCSNHSHGNEVWTVLRGLKQLHLYYLSFRDSEVQPVCDIICQQKDTLEVLCLPVLDICWNRTKSRRSFVLAVGACKHLVKLELQGCVLMDSDLKIMLHDLPNLCILNLARDRNHNHEFTDNTCGLIARKCPGLQELCVNNHDQLSVRGIRKIFDGCSHLRSFYTSTRKLSSEDVQSLLDIAPQLMHLAFQKNGISAGDLDKIIEATGGRTVLQLSNRDHYFSPCDSDCIISAETREIYECQKRLLIDIGRRWNDPEVANKWAGVLKG